MSGVYSKRFLGAQNTSTSVVAVVPSGKVWVVKSIDFLLGSTSGTAGFQVAGIWLAFGTDLKPPPGSTSSVWQWRGMQVANAGENIVLWVTAGIWSGMASGYELSA